jgi:uncharacterized protein YbdZ (MbtH family)
VSTYAFDNDNGIFFVLVNDEHQHGRWPVFADVPASWSEAFGAAARDACLGHV